MNGLHLKIALTICTIIILATVLFHVEFDKNDNHEECVNNGLTSLFKFDVDCPEVGTSIGWTFFVMQSEHSVKMKMAADLIVGEMDERGVEFFVPAELDIVSILCSYKGVISSEYIHVWEYPTGGNYVRIAREHPSQSGGGQGMLIMELQLSKSVKLSNIDSLTFNVEFGSVSEDVTIPMSH